MTATITKNRFGRFTAKFMGHSDNFDTIEDVNNWIGLLPTKLKIERSAKKEYEIENRNRRVEEF